MNNEQKLPLAEIKAGLKLAKEVYEILKDDTDYIRRIRLHLERIDAALQSGNLDIILHCNELVANEYRSLLARNNFRHESLIILKEKGLYWNFFNLRDIGQLLYNEICKDKVKDGVKSILAVSCEHICDKIADSYVVHLQEQHQ